MKLTAKDDFMNGNNKAEPTRFPQEMPEKNKKTYGHGVIEDVVRNEIEPASAANPVKPADTDCINSEFAKSRKDINL